MLANQQVWDENEAGKESEVAIKAGLHGADWQQVFGNSRKTIGMWRRSTGIA